MPNRKITSFFKTIMKKRKNPVNMEPKAQKGREMTQKTVDSFFKTILKKRKRRTKPVKPKGKENLKTQKKMTDYWDEFSYILSTDFYGIFTPYGTNMKDFMPAFRRKNYY